MTVSAILPSARLRLPGVGRLVLLVPIAALFAISFAWPLITILLRSFNETGRADIASGLFFGNYTSIVLDDLLRQVALHTAYLSAVSTVVTVIFAFPTAYLISRLPPRASSFFMILVLIPFWVSILIRLFAFTAILGTQGLVNQFFGLFNLGPYSLLYNTGATIIGMVAYLLPYMILILISAMSAMDPALLTAAHTMGATQRQAFWHIYLPQIRPALVSGAVLVFVLGLGFFLTPAILGGPRDLTIPIYIQQQVSLFQWGRAAATGVVLLVVSFCGYILALRVGGTRLLVPGHRSGSRGAVARDPFKLSIGIWVSIVMAAGVLCLLLLPLIVVIPSAFGETFQIRFPPVGFTFRWFHEVLTNPLWTSAVFKSLRVGVLTAMVATALGLALARIGTQLKSGSARAAVQSLAIAPVIAPVILLAIGIFDVQTHLKLIGSEFGLIIGHAIICLPLTFLILANALRTSDPSLEHAAWTLGVGPIRAFWTIVIPNIVPAILGAALISFATSWDEAVISLFQVGLEKTLPVTIYSFLKSGVTPAVAAIADIVMLPIFLGAASMYAIGAIRSSRRAANR